MASDIYNTGKDNVTGAYNAGNSAVQSFDPNAWQSTTAGGYNNLWNTQDSTQNKYIQGFKDQIASQPTATSLYDTANDKFNVPGLKNTATTLNNAVLTTPQSNLDAAKGFNFDNNQVGQKTSQDLQRLSPLAIAATANANTAEELAGNYVTAGMAQNAYELQPTQEQGTYLMDAYARQQSGFTTTQQSQLDALKQKMMSGVQLSSDEMKAFSDLSSAESNYQGTLATANASIKSAQLNNQFKIVPQNENIINTANNSALNPTLANPTGIRKF